MWQPHTKVKHEGGKGSDSEAQSGVRHPPALPCLPPVGFFLLGTSWCIFRPWVTTGAIPRTGFQVSPLYSELYRQRGPT